MSWGQQFTMTQLVDAASAAGFPDAQAAIMGAIAMAESGGRMIVNRSTAETPSSLRGTDRCASYGPWQINYCPTRDKGSAREQATRSTQLVAHARIAKGIHASQGFGAWSVTHNGAHERYLDAASRAVGTRTDTDSSVGAAINQTIAEADGQLSLLGFLRDPARVGWLALGIAVAGVGLVLIVKESSPAGLATSAVLDVAKAAA